MASGRPTFKVSTRDDFGSRTARRLRRDGQVPGVVYTSGEDARPFQANAHDITLFLAEGHALFDLEIEGSGAVPVVVKEQQRHPVRGELIHLDCQEVDLDTAIQADVSLELIGTEDAPGVKEGGILEHVTREVTVEALPTDIPDSLSIDVSAMVIGDTLNLEVLVLPDGVELVADNPEEITLATLNPPRVEEEPELEEETELVGEEGEPAEGDEGEGESEGAADDGGDEGSDGGDEG
jgi:large subunit ribosomal protein L25